MKLRVNAVETEVPEGWKDEPLVSVLRDALGLTGTKFGCGKGLCGACTVHLDGVATRACVLPVRAAEGKSITTIEGLAQDGALHPVQQAWIDESVPQCGYCQAGQIMSAAALLAAQPEPDAEAITAAMEGNLCRCGTYGRIRRGIARAATLQREGR
ncbi:MAG: (2Fe-2S)-binding protein [Pseudomonadota bacterium]